MPAISVIIPIYQVEKYIDRCLKSVFEQTLQDMEVICVDDCGRDGSMHIVQKYFKEHPDKMKIIKNPSNLGLGASRDAGISAAKGTYLTFIDSDDYIAQDYLEHYWRAAQTGADIIVGGYYRVKNNKSKQVSVDLTDPWYMWVNVSAWGKIYRADFLHQNHINFRNIRRYEDGFFAYRCLLVHPDIVRISYDGYYYIQNEGSITQNRNCDRSVLFTEFIDNCYNFLHEISLDPCDENTDALQYCLMQALSINLLYNGFGCGKEKMNSLFSKYNFFMQTIEEETGGDALYNHLISLKKPKSEPKKNKLASFLILRARRRGNDKKIFDLAATL